MPVRTDNPAGRLYTIFDRARNQDEKTKTTAVWAYALNVRFDDQIEFLHRYQQLAALVDEATKALKSLDGLNEDLYLSEFQKFQQAISIPLWHGQWINVKNLLSDTAMLRLAFCSEELSRRHTETPLRTEDLNSLLKDSEALARRVLDSDLPPDLKAFLIEQLNLIRQAVIEYRIRGAVVIRDAVEKMAGALILRRDVIEPHAKTPEVKEFGEIVTRADKLVALALKLKQLGEAIIPPLAMLLS